MKKTSRIDPRLLRPISTVLRDSNEVMPRSSEISALRASEQYSETLEGLSQRISNFWCIRIDSNKAVPHGTDWIVGNAAKGELARGSGLPPRDIARTPGAEKVIVNPCMFILMAVHAKQELGP